MSTMRAHRFLPLCIIAALLCACGDAPDDEAQRRADAAEAGLPKPQRADGSVTGMPGKPGPGDVPITGAPPPPPPELLPGEAFGLPPLEDNPETGLADDGTATSADEPSVDDAVAIVRDYYAAIAAGDFARAYGLWSDGGRSSGQTPEQFAAGFADTAKVEVVPGEPGAIEGAAGSRYVEIPVSVNATQRDGSVRKYIGSYVLRRAVVDDASAEQRAWRIGSAELREVRP